MKQKILLTFLLVVLGTLSACGGSSGTSLGGSPHLNGSNQYQAVAMPSPLTGTLYDAKVTVTYALMVPLGSTFLGTTMNAGIDAAHTYKYALLLSDQPITCGRDFSSSNQPDGLYIAFLYFEKTVGANGGLLQYESVGSGWVGSGASSNGGSSGTITAVDATSFSGNLNYFVQNNRASVLSTSSFVGSFVAQSCVP